MSDIKKRGNPNFGKPGVGNRFSKDNQPLIKGRKQNNLATLLNEGCSKADLLDIFKAQVQKAKDGDNDSAKLVLSYVVGKPETFNLMGESDSDTFTQQNILNLNINPQNVTFEQLLQLATAKPLDNQVIELPNE